VLLAEKVEESRIGKIIGKVKVEVDDMTGGFYGDASNYLKKRTKYYEIKGVPVTSTIAVEYEDHWVKGIYVDKAPFHPMNLLMNEYFVASVILVILGVGL